jgi:dTDP-4-amino-4,6-dideoxygalactose transaminase
MKVAPIDLRAAYVEFKDELDAAISEVVSQGTYVLGLHVNAFEAEWAAYVGAAHCKSVGNGLEALHISLLAVGVGPGDEVIVPSNTYIATWLAVTHCGATPVPVEPDPLTYNIDVNRIAAAITPKTTAILPVHLYGQSADLGPIVQLAHDAGIAVVEDAAQAHGAGYRGSRVGSHGDAVAWSFYPTKNLGAFGDGGAVTTNDEDIDRRVGSLRNYGESAKYRNDIRGFNSRLDEVQAAILSVKLRHLDAANERRRRIASQYAVGLKGTLLALPFVPEWADPVWHQFVVRSADRDGLATRMRQRGVQSLVHYPTPPHLQVAYADMGLAPGSLPVSEAIHRDVLSLPIHAQMSDDDVATVVDVVTATAR